MILRKGKINPSADETSFQVSYTTADVKRWIVQYTTLLQNCGIDIQSTSESDLRHFLEHDPLKGFPDKYASQLSRWAIATALRKKYLEISASDPTLLLISDSLKPKSE